MAARKKKAEPTEATIKVIRIERGECKAAIIGRTPLVFNSMSSKAQHSILYPSPPKSKEEKAINLKHYPYAEYLDSADWLPAQLPVNSLNTGNREGDTPPTLLALRASQIKAALRDAARTAEGLSMADAGRLLWTQGDYIPVYGVPRLLMRGVRCADQQRTPDIRTWCAIPEWACVVHIVYHKPRLNHQHVMDLLANAGQVVGIGDGRPDKQKLNQGTFELVASNDRELLRIMKAGGRAAQLSAMERPVGFYDDSSRELFEWFESEAERRNVILEDVPYRDLGAYRTGEVRRAKRKG